MKTGIGSIIAGTALSLAIMFGAGASPLASDRPDPGVPEVREIPAGAYMRGSGPAQREAAYKLDEAAYGHSRTRAGRWYEGEFPYGRDRTRAYAIMVTPVTNREYARFVEATGHPAPGIGKDIWQSYGLIHPYARAKRHAWRDGTYPEGRADHPVVMVSYGDAWAYAGWLSARTGQQWRLPTEAEWEKAARGGDGRWFPWGIEFDPARLNSHDKGPFDTVPVGRYPQGASPFGILDMAGQVFEWTGTGAGQDRRIVKGGSWDDSGCGVCRAAARHGRPEAIKHILIGFRLVREVE